MPSRNKWMPTVPWFPAGHTWGRELAELLTTMSHQRAVTAPQQQALRRAAVELYLLMDYNRNHLKAWRYYGRVVSADDKMVARSAQRLGRAKLLPPQQAPHQQPLTTAVKANTNKGLAATGTAEATAGSATNIKRNKELKRAHLNLNCFMTKKNTSPAKTAPVNTLAQQLQAKPCLSNSARAGPHNSGVAQTLGQAFPAGQQDAATWIPTSWWQHVRVVYPAPLSKVSALCQHLAPRFWAHYTRTNEARTDWFPAWKTWVKNALAD